MRRAPVLASILLLGTLGIAQQPTNNPPDRTTANTTDQGYNRPVDTGGHGWGGWGLLGLLGLAGLFGRRRASTTTTYVRDDTTYGERERQRRVG